MFIAILQHTPLWVWGLFAGLVALGLSQTRDREASPLRVTVLPVVMIALSLIGVVGAFGLHPQALAGWTTGLGVAVAFARDAVALRGVRWSAQSGRLHLPGSWLPMGMILAIFFVKYAAGISLGLHPSLAADPVFSTGCSLAYGLFSGLFLARALSIRAAVGGDRRASPPATAAGRTLGQNRG